MLVRRSVMRQKNTVPRYVMCSAVRHVTFSITMTRCYHVSSTGFLRLIRPIPSHPSHPIPSHPIPSHPI
ncbi:hypothetical protein CLOP_g22203 [Closterium sp. NIES-67]|nr:hypothetical protein CLOP_g22203 [Closterium sp. NIES-67]